MSDKYSAEWVAEQVAANGYTQLDHHDCSMCGYICRYVFEPRNVVYFDPGCYCTSGSGPRFASYEDVAGWLAMQSSDEIRESILKGFRPTPASSIAKDADT
jgi:hypothetical protein